MDEVWTEPNGYTLYAGDDPVGGRFYMSDAVGGGVTVWNTSIVTENQLRAAMQIEKRDEFERRHLTSPPMAPWVNFVEGRASKGVYPPGSSVVTLAVGVGHHFYEVSHLRPPDEPLSKKDFIHMLEAMLGQLKGGSNG